MITIIFGVAAVSTACVEAVVNTASSATRQSDSAEGGTNDFIDLSLPTTTYGNPNYLTCDLISLHEIVAVSDFTNGFFTKWKHQHDSVKGTSFMVADRFFLDQAGEGRSIRLAVEALILSFR